MKSFQLPNKTLNWLLEDTNPPVRNMTKKFLIDQTLSTDEIAEVNGYHPIEKLISLIKPDGSWSNSKNPYKKYTGNYWQLIFLCELNANPDELIRKAGEQILSYQLPEGGFTHKIGSKFPLICLTANIIRSLIHFEINDERTQKGIVFLTQRILNDQGTFCSPDPLYTLLPDCQMALTKALALYATLNNNKLNEDIKRAVDIIVDKILENRVFRYIPSGAKDYYNLIKGKKSVEIRKIRKQMISQPKVFEKTEIKKSWLKFGFPQSYTSDALETLYWLVMSKIPYHQEFDEAITHIIQSMDPTGYWVNQSSFRNPMLVEIEPKNAPSKWLTFRACFVLKNYCNFSIQD
ncbi:MAG: prenyltransferase/squalene oxidase repeat-containing protein [Promethearchaeota archaeon]